MTLLIILTFFLFGYWVANWQNKKKLEVARLVGKRDFIYSYCQNLQEICNLMLEKVKSETLDDEQKTRNTHMIGTLSHVHDELIKNWKEEGEIRLIELIDETLKDKVVFGRALDKKMKELVAFEDLLNLEDPKKQFEHLAENFSLIEQIRSWVMDYTKKDDSYIKTVAIETVTLLEAKKRVLKIIESGLETNNCDILSDEETMKALEKQAYHTDRYANAMQLLFWS